MKTLKIYLKIIFKWHKRWVCGFLLFLLFIWKPYLWFYIKFLIFLFICYMIFCKSPYLKNKKDRKKRSSYWKKAWFLIFLDKILIWIWNKFISFYLKIKSFFYLLYAYFISLTLFWQIVVIIVLICILIFLYFHYYVY
jgi:hypothetical protein